MNFTINENTGTISTNLDLDREAKDSYLFTVTAKDTASQITTATVTIAITDANDNSPVCSQAVYTASVLESATAGSSVLTVSCPDIDINFNGQVCSNH
jgi:VCBS repeat-containing protein